MASTLLTWWMIGPKTRGGLMVAPSNEGFSSWMNFQNAFSAKVLDAETNMSVSSQTGEKRERPLTSVLVAVRSLSALFVADLSAVLVPVLLGEAGTISLSSIAAGQKWSGPRISERGLTCEEP